MMCAIRLLTLLFVTFDCLISCSCVLKVSIRENHNIAVEPFRTRINKRDITQFFDRASYSFNGLEKVESVPIIFPLDICIFKVNEVKHAACLHITKQGDKNFVIFRADDANYEELLRLEAPLAVGMDCKSFGERGFVALAFNITTPIERADQGSPIFQVDSDRIKAVQYFNSLHLRTIYLRTTANDLFLLQTFDNARNTSNKSLFCPFLKWSGYGFNKLGRIPCTNARRLEPFTMESESYVAVANYADKYGRTQTNSEIYKYDREKKKLISFQKIKTNAAVDVKYFSVPYEEVKKKHFLIFGNSAPINSVSADKLQADSVVYMYEKGNFVPYQMLSLYSVQKFLPVENREQEKFILLVACSNQDIKIYNLNDWKFEESKSQFTEGALGKGVSNMRIIEDDDQSYLVIANERMSINETNIFRPIFTQEEHANTLRQEIIDWTSATVDRLNKIDVEKVKNNLAAATAKIKHQQPLDIQELPSATVEIAYTRSLVNPKRNMTSSYWQALSYAYQAIEALEARVAKKIAKRRHADENSEYVQETLNVGTLVVRNKLKANTINGIDPLDIRFKTISAPKIIVNGDFQRPPEPRSDVSPEFLDVIDADNLQITGTLNGMSWEDLQGNTLKKSGQQFIKAPVKISKLKTDKFVSSSNVISGQNLSRLVPIDGGSYVINQNIKFTKPIHVNNLTILDRMNSILVVQNKLDVLLVHSDEVQHINGMKTFENIKVLEPVTVSGKIFGNLDAMSPFKPIHKSINLTGDYTITGDVSVRNILSASNVFGSNESLSLQTALDDGIAVTGPFDGMNIHFVQPIEAHQVNLTSVNDLDAQELVRMNSDEVQIIKAHKSFTGDLHVSKGFAEVKVLNGIDVGELENKILTKTGPQNVTGNFKFRKVYADSLSSPSIQLQGKPLSNYLTRTGDQTVKGSLKAGKFKAQHAAVGNLQTKHKVFHQEHPASVLPMRESSEIPDPDLLKNYEGTIYVENLKVEGFINEYSMEDIERWLTQLNGNIKFVGSMNFHTDWKISNLTFTGTFNGIPAKDFGNCWLQQNQKQTFTAPQTFTSVRTNGLVVTGKINEHPVDELTSGIYWINRDEYIPHAIFDNSIQVDTDFRSSTINGLHIPEDILLRDSPEPQILNGEMICDGEMLVEGPIRNLKSVNGVNLALLSDYLNGNITTVAVENASFESAPQFDTLNAHNLKETIGNVWLANADVDLQHHVEIADAYFEGPLEFEGPINGVNLKYLKDNYFSLSKPQQVSAEILFTNEVTFEGTINGENLHLYGQIVDANSGTEFDFNDFVQNALLKNAEQKITGQWKIYEGLIAGDLDKVQINGLNLADDVVRLDVPLNKVTGSKFFESASVEKLHSGVKTTLNGVDLSNWVRKAVFVYDNYTIHGRTTLESLTVRRNMQVQGTVNNLTFDENTLLLRDRPQVIRGNVKFSTEKEMPLPTFAELNTKRINTIDVDEFFSGQAVLKPDAVIEGLVKFLHPVQCEFFDAKTAVTDYENVALNSIANKVQKAISDLDRFVQDLAHSYKEDKFYLSHFEHKQTINVPATKVITLTLKFGDEFIDLIGVLNEPDDSNVLFYRWDVYLQQFVMDKHLSWLPRRRTLIDIFRVVFGKAEYLAIETSLGGKFYQNVISPETMGLQEIFRTNASRMIEALELDGDQCFVAYKKENGVLSVYCVEFNEKGLQFIPKNELKRDGVMQIVSFEKDLIGLLLENSVEIWKPNEPEMPKQTFTAANPSQIAAVVAPDSSKYFTICSRSHPQMFHDGSVDIYRSTGNTPFEYMQTIEAVSPIQVEFAVLPESEDILLNILTESFDEPLAIYEYKGIVGFQPIVDSSTILPGNAISVIHLKATKLHLLAVMSKDDVTFIEMVLNKT